jgi:class 3 adenylate cyclase
VRRLRAREPAARREERKVVTVLLADLVGFTSRAERMDPEDVRALLAPYWESVGATRWISDAEALLAVTA